MYLYHPAVMTDWQGRTDAKGNEYFYQIIKLVDLSILKEKNLNGIALLGFESDLGIKRNQGRIGAAAGSRAIKQAFAKLPVHKVISIYDAGSIIPENNDLNAAQSALGDAVSKLLNAGLFPIVLGGGHETAWGHYQGLTHYLTNTTINIVNFDAHFDLRDIPADYIGTSGTSFRQIALNYQQKKTDFNYYCIGIQQINTTHSLFETANNLKTHYLLADDIHAQGVLAVEQFLAPVLADNSPIYVSICLDVFAACFAPGVSAPQPLGLNPWQVISSLKHLAASGKVISLDIVELAPNYDIDQHTTKLAAQLLSLFINYIDMEKIW